MDGDEVQKLILTATGNLNISGAYQIAGTQIVGAQQAAIADLAETGSAQDATARATINDILTALRTHGLIAT